MSIIKNLLKNPSYGKNADLALLFIRIAAAGFMLYGHGYPKLIKILGGDMQFADPIGIGAEFSLILVFIAEFLCALFILIGFIPKLAAVPLIINLLVIVVIVHVNDGFARLELSLFYLFSYFAIFVAGAGKYSVQAMLSKNK